MTGRLPDVWTDNAAFSGGVSGTLTTAWVTEYDWTPATDGTVDLNALDGSTYTDGEGVTWNVSVDGAASAPSFGIHASDGLGVSGAGSANDIYAYITATVRELVESGGGPTYDPHTDAVEIWIELASLSFGGNWMWWYTNIAHHGGAGRYDGIGRWNDSGSILRRGSIDDNTSAASESSAVDATFGADGVFAWRIIGTEIGCAYKTTPTISTDFDALTENVNGNRYLASAVRPAAGDSDLAEPEIAIVFVSSTFGSTTQRVKRVVVRRYRGALV